MTDTQTTDAVAALTGFYAKPRTRRVECDWLEPDEGAEPLYALVRTDIPIGVTDELPYGRQHTHREGWEAVAPWVVEWNATGWNVATNQRTPVPAPAVGGPDVFKWVDPIIVEWLMFTLRTTYLSIVDPKALTSPAPTESKPSDPASVSSAPAKSSKRSRTDSPAPSPTT